MLLHVMNPMKPRRPCAAGCGGYGATPQAIYCSRKCQHERGRQERYKLSLSGDYPPVGYNTQFFRRLVIRYIGKEECTRCGWAKRHPDTVRIPVEIEHIDGDWRNNHPE